MLTQNKTSVRAEVLAGVTTFLSMAYIIVVQPAVAFRENARHGYRPGFWRSDNGNLHLVRAGNGDLGPLRALPNRAGWLTYLLAIVLVLYFVFVRSRIG
jgi:hypothetical protein